jgi:hypothetical protein
VYDFSPYNDLTSWNNYAASIGATTNFNWWSGAGGQLGPEQLGGGCCGFMQLTLPVDYNYVKVNYQNAINNYGWPVKIYINGVLNNTTDWGSVSLISPTSTDLSIGDNFGWVRTFNGTIR